MIIDMQIVCARCKHRGCYVFGDVVLCPKCELTPCDSCHGTRTCFSCDGKGTCSHCAYQHNSYASYGCSECSYTRMCLHCYGTGACDMCRADIVFGHRKNARCAMCGYYGDACTCGDENND